MSGTDNGERSPETMRGFKKPMAVIAGALVTIAIALVCFQCFALPSHRHCIVSAGLMLTGYAMQHGGQYPTSEKGWGDALLEIRERGSADAPYWVAVFVGVDDEGSVLLNALQTGEDVDESKCRRVYVQGLSTDSNPAIALLFDRESVRGDDHLRSPFRARLREVFLVGGSRVNVTDDAWPGFVAKQRTLLRDEGFSEAAIEAVYGEVPKEGEQAPGTVADKPRSSG